MDYATSHMDDPMDACLSDGASISSPLNSVASKKRLRSWDVPMANGSNGIENDPNHEEKTPVAQLEALATTYLCSRRVDKCHSAIKIQFGPAQYLIDYGTKPLWTTFLKTLLDDSTMRDQQEARNGKVVMIETSHIPLDDDVHMDLVVYDVAFSLLAFGAFCPTELRSMKQMVGVLELVEPFCVRLPALQIKHWTRDVWALQYQVGSFEDALRTDFDRLAQRTWKNNMMCLPTLVDDDGLLNEHLADDFPCIKHMLSEFISVLDLYDIMNAAHTGQSTTITSSSLSEWRANDLWCLDFWSLTSVEQDIVGIMGDFLRHVSMYLHNNQASTSAEFVHQILHIIAFMVVQLFDPNRAWNNLRPPTMESWSTLILKPNTSNNPLGHWLTTICRSINGWPLWSLQVEGKQETNNNRISGLSTTLRMLQVKLPHTPSQVIMLNGTKVVQTIMDHVYHTQPEQLADSWNRRSLSSTIANTIMNQRDLAPTLWRRIQKITAMHMIRHLCNTEFRYDEDWGGGIIREPPLDCVTLVDTNDIAHVFYRDESTLSAASLYQNGQSVNVDDVCNQIHSDRLCIRRIILGFEPTTNRFQMYCQMSPEDCFLGITESLWDMSDQFIASAPEYNCLMSSTFTKETSMLWIRWADGVSQYKAPSITLVFPEYDSIIAQSHNIQNYLRYHLNYYDHWMQTTLFKPPQPPNANRDVYRDMHQIDTPGSYTLHTHFQNLLDHVNRL